MSAPASPAGASVRGSALLPSRAFIEKRFGKEAWPRFLDRLPPPARHAFDATLSPLAWYPLAVADRAVAGAVELAGGDLGVVRELAFFSLDFATNFIFRAIFKLGSPEFMVARSDQIWRKYYSHGTMSARTARGNATVELRDFPEITPLWNLTVMHSVEAIIVKAGGVVRRVHQTRDVLRGAPLCEYVYEWS